MNKITKLWTAYKNGIKRPLTVSRVCDELDFPFYALCAFLEQESAGGDNVFGHDPTIFVGAGRVTKAKYLAYKKQRISTGKMQGVGPMQLTWYSYQDQADALGGCWVPYNNITVGTKLLKQYWEDGKNSWQYVGTKYNGSSAYGTEIAARIEKWRKLLS